MFYLPGNSEVLPESGYITKYLVSKQIICNVFSAFTLNHSAITIFPYFFYNSAFESFWSVM